MRCSSVILSTLKREVMDNLRSKLDEVITYLRPLLALTNSHTVSFITDNTWSKVMPKDILLEVELLGVNEVIRRYWKNVDDNCALLQFSKTARLHTIEHSDVFLPLSELQLRLNRLITNNYKPVKLSKFMTAKKLHEVEAMSEIVSRIAAATNASHVIDIGSGKGYLSSVLVLQHHFKVLGIDCNHVNTHGAADRTVKFEKYWNALKCKAENADNGNSNSNNYDSCKNGENNKTARQQDVTVKEKCSSNEEYYDKYKWRSAVLDNLYKQRTESITEDTDLMESLRQEYPNDYYDSLCVTGLHTCGDLSSTCLRLFANDAKITSFINIGCCYHLTREQFATDPKWSNSPSEFVPTTSTYAESYGFPLSTYLRLKKFSLGRDARMCGTQFPQKIFEEKDLVQPTKPLFYRALLQQLLVSKYGNDDVVINNTVGRIAHKCDTFPEYVYKALKRLNLNIQVGENELEKLQLDHMQDWEHLKIFFLVKTSLASVIESVIIMDRLLYLHEMGVNDAFVTKLFDPLLSPRCYAIIGIKSNPTLNIFK